MQKQPLIILTGPTAVGKTKASIGLAKAIGGEIISADSMQVYKYMDIGSAKIRPEEMQHVPHYLVDELEPDDEFHVVRFQQMAEDALQKIYAKDGKRSYEKDLCCRAYSNRSRRNRILYSGTTL